MKKIYLKKITAFGFAGILSFSLASSAGAFECKVKQSSMAKPSGYPSRALTMIVPYGPAGGSGQIAAAMAEAVTSLTDVSINRDHTFLECFDLRSTWQLKKANYTVICGRVMMN